MKWAQHLGQNRQPFINHYAQCACHYFIETWRTRRFGSIFNAFTREKAAHPVILIQNLHYNGSKNRKSWIVIFYNVALDCSQLSVFSYFHSTAERADRIARDLDANPKRKTWRGRGLTHSARLPASPPPPPSPVRSSRSPFFHMRRKINRENVRMSSLAWKPT